MTPHQFKNLQQGDIVRPRWSGNSYVVTGNYGDFVLAVRTVHMANPEEWDLIKVPASKAHQPEEP